MRGRARVWMLGAALAAGLAAPSSAGAAGFAIDDFSVDVSTPQAGGHPDVTVTTAFPGYPSLGVPPDRVRDVRLSLPPGLLGNPNATAQCPQAAFSSGGAKAVLANPTSCGDQTMTARLTPWSGGPDATPTATFATDADGAGGACAAPQFRPALAVDVADRSAGRPAGAVTLRLSRPDGDEGIGRVVTAFPPGLAGSITGVGICPEGRVAAAGDCPRPGSPQRSAAAGTRRPGRSRR